MKSYLPAALFGTVLTAAAVSFGATAAHASAGYAHHAGSAIVIVDTTGAQ